LGALRLESGWLGRQNRLPRYGEDAEVELGIHQATGLVSCDIDTQLLEETENRTGLYRARSVVVTGDEDHGRVWESLAEPLELPKGKDDRGVARPDGMKQVTREDDHVGSSGDHAVNRGAEGVGDISFPLIDAERSLPMVLADTQVRVRNVGQFHGWIGYGQWAIGFGCALDTMGQLPNTVSCSQ
jgi:hypothetical protein